MVVWQMPCESSSPPGSQLSQKAQSKDWAFLHFIPMRPVRLERTGTAQPARRGEGRRPGIQNVWNVFGPPKAGPKGTNPMDEVSTKTSGTFLNGAAGPKGGGQDARNNVVHRTQIQNRSAQTTTNICSTIKHGRPQGTPLQPIASYLYLCKSTQIQTDTKS
jgi:hypothetical protein